MHLTVAGTSRFINKLNFDSLLFYVSPVYKKKDMQKKELFSEKSRNRELIFRAKHFWTVGSEVWNRKNAVN